MRKGARQSDSRRPNPPMPERPLARDFAACSPLLGTDQPVYVSTADCLAELQEEMDRRRRVYPRFVDKGTMTPEVMERHLLAWQVMVDDHAWALGKRALSYRLTWEDRVRELRRELTLRRVAYPKWIANPTNPLTEEKARAKLQRLDYVHHRYWQGWCLLPPVEITHPEQAADAQAFAKSNLFLLHPVWHARMETMRVFDAWQRGEDDSLPDLSFPGQLQQDATGAYQGSLTGDTIANEPRARGDTR